MNVTEKLHQLMLRPCFQAREDQQTLLDGMKEIERLRIAFVEAARLLTLEQLQGLSAESVHILADLGLIGAKR